MPFSWGPLTGSYAPSRSRSRSPHSSLSSCHRDVFICSCCNACGTQNRLPQDAFCFCFCFSSCLLFSGWNFMHTTAKDLLEGPKVCNKLLHVAPTFRANTMRRLQVSLIKINTGPSRALVFFQKQFRPLCCVVHGPRHPQPHCVSICSFYCTEHAPRPLPKKRRL